MKSKVEYDIESMLKQGYQIMLFQSGETEFTCIIKKDEEIRTITSDKASLALSKAGGAGEDQVTDNKIANYNADFTAADSDVLSVLFKNGYYIKFYRNERNVDDIVCAEEPVFEKCNFSFVQPFVKNGIVDCIKHINQTLSGLSLELLRKMSWEDAEKTKMRLREPSNEVEFDVSMSLAENLFGQKFLRDVTSSDGKSKK